MRNNTGSQTVTTTNFVTYRDRTEVASATWTPEQAFTWRRTLSEFKSAHLENDLDTNGYRVSVEVFEYDLPGLHVTALVEDGTVQTVVTVSDDTAVRLHKAVRRQHPVTISYVNAEGESLVRTIEPRRLQVTKTGAVIVKALDRKSGEHRSFRLDRITSYSVHRTSFIVPEPVKATAIPAPVQAPLGTVYLTDPDLAARWDSETVLDRLAEAWATGHGLTRVYA